MEGKIGVGILGATGAVGQKFIELLDGHPWFEVRSLVASERSAGQLYGDAVNWIGRAPIPEWARGIRIRSHPASGVNLDIPEKDRAGGRHDCQLLFSGLDASVAGEMESKLASSGYAVVSNAKNHRMDTDVPLMIPEVNPEHIRLIEQQATYESGFIVTNPNCVTVGLVIPLKPLHDAFGIESVQVTTMQALSGAGYPGVSSLDILGNVIPFIGGEQEKIQSEPLKLLGTFSADGIIPARMAISAQCNRVPVIDGHLLSVSVSLKSQPELRAVRDALSNFKSPVADHCLPSAPDSVIRVYRDDTAPQPGRHVNTGSGMTVCVGGIECCSAMGYRFVSLVHNTIRGAAGGALLNAELLVKMGYLNWNK